MESSSPVSRSLLTTALAGVLLLACGGVASAAALHPGATAKAANESYIFRMDQARLTPHRRYELSAAPIHSRATLKIYLAQTKMAASPLHYLSPGARRRFLASLAFNDKGLASFYYKDLVQLPIPDADFILNLFGAASTAGLLRTCLLPEATASPADRRSETATDVLVAPCEDLLLDQDAYLESTAALNISNSDQYASYEYQEYRRLLSHYQNVNTLQHLRNADLQILFNITPTVSSLNVENIQLRRDVVLEFHELEHRHIATQSNVQEMYISYIEARMFQDARRFAGQHPKADLSPVPGFKQARALPAGVPTELVVSTTKREMVRQPVYLDRGARIVVVATPECHFARHGLLAINADFQLKSVFGKYAVWLAPGYYGLDFDTYQKWNRQHPEEQIGIAYRRSEWPMITYWALPTFYFFKNGKLVEQLIGWWPNPPASYKYRDSEGNIPNLKKALRKIGLLPAPA